MGKGSHLCLGLTSVNRRDLFLFVHNESNHETRGQEMAVKISINNAVSDLYISRIIPKCKDDKIEVSVV